MFAVFTKCFYTLLYSLTGNLILASSQTVKFLIENMAGSMMIHGRKAWALTLPGILLLVNSSSFFAVKRIYTQVSHVLAKIKNVVFNIFLAEQVKHEIATKHFDL